MWTFVSKFSGSQHPINLVHRSDKLSTPDWIENSWSCSLTGSFWFAIQQRKRQIHARGKWLDDWVFYGYTHGSVYIGSGHSSSQKGWAIWLINNILTFLSYAVTWYTSQYLHIFSKITLFNPLIIPAWSPKMRGNINNSWYLRGLNFSECPDTVSDTPRWSAIILKWN